MIFLKILFYLVVLILVLVLAYVTTRFLARAGSGQKNSGIRILDRTAIGHDSFLLVVRVQERILLLGVSPAGITKLEELEDYQELNPAEKAPDFASMLAGQLKIRGIRGKEYTGSGEKEHEGKI